MCTSFVYRKENVLIGMNFDNDGKRFRIFSGDGKGFLVSVEINGNYYPSFGVSSTGLFVNNLIVDSNGEGKYKRQNDKRWVVSSIVSRVFEGKSDFDSLREQVGQVEIVNGPFMSTHAMIADILGRTLVVEPGRKNIYSTGKDSNWYVMTNFPLTEYDDLVPQNPSGSGADRFEAAVSYLSSHDGPLTVDQGFDLLNRVRQDGPEWKTVLSLVFDPARSELSYILAEKPDVITKLTLK
jgi:hypothetical protein